MIHQPGNGFLSSYSSMSFVAEFNVYFLAAFFSFVAFSFYIVISQTSKQAGVPVVCMGEKGSRHYRNHLVFRVFRILIWFACVARLFFPEFVQGVAISVVVPDWVMVIGDILLVTGLGLCLGICARMGGNWRSGVDPVNTPSLITDGPFAWSRNPSFIGVIMGQVGFLLAWPCVFSLICLLVGVRAVLLQVELEESFLSERLPGEYQAYKQRVRRWF